MELNEDRGIRGKYILGKGQKGIESTGTLKTPHYQSIKHLTEG